MFISCCGHQPTLSQRRESWPRKNDIVAQIDGLLLMDFNVHVDPSFLHLLRAKSQTIYPSPHSPSSPSPSDHVIFPTEAEAYVQELSPFSITEIGSERWEPSDVG